ncbi:MAG: polysaccharide deacetylase family protein [Salegentibacter mishustinae]|nr:polysaccharide deacetylase family protein [Salegentibacter mishustinae]
MNIINKNGFLVLSLDFELLWGIFDVVDFSKKEKYVQNTLDVIPKILNLFEDKEIHCTWAIVGMLFNNDWEEWKNNIPKITPSYKDSNLSAYNFGENNFKYVKEDMCFAPKIVKRISETPGQEIGSHTYSHFYCNEYGQNLEQFETDLLQMNKMAQKIGVEIKSLVFPRNQFNQDYLKICAKNGIETVRSNPSDWYWKDTSSESVTTRLFRTGDVYFPLGKRKSYPISDLKKEVNIPLPQKASRFFRPVENNANLRRLKIRRIKDEMNSAAKNGEIYHLWWHPHNFGESPNESMEDLNEIIGCFLHNKEEFNFQSATMLEIKKKLENGIKE